MHHESEEIVWSGSGCSMRCEMWHFYG